MSEKQYLLVECYNQMWGIYDKKQSKTDNPVLIAYSKARVGFIVNQLNNKNERIKKLKKENERLKYHLEHKQEHINQLTRKPLLTDILPQAHDILRINSELEEENEQLKKAAKEFAQNQTQHNLWRLRTVLKDSGVE